MITNDPNINLIPDALASIPSSSHSPAWEQILNPDYISSLANDLFREGVHHQNATPQQEHISKHPEVDGQTPATEKNTSQPAEEFSASAARNPFPASNGYVPPEDGTSRQTQNTIQDYYFLSNPKVKTAAAPDEKESAREELDIQAFRNDFPILKQHVNGKPLIWFDNAATTQKPQAVMDTLNQYYREYNSNIHRAAHTLAKKATAAYENAREKIQQFIGASSPEEIIFVRGTTEGINLVAQAYGRVNIHAGDEILLSRMEHHSNIVPWQLLQKETGAVIKVIPINDRGEIILAEYEKLFTPRTRFVGITHVSNVLGSINPVRQMTEIAHLHKACVLVDGAQSAPHFKVNVREMDADFYTFSGHKIYGPNGIGILFGKKALLEAMPPWQGGGGMIKRVTFEETIYQNPPYKFEAGTGNIADAIGLGAAVDYLQKIGLANIERHERCLTGYAIESLSKLPGLCLIGTASDKISVVSFIISGISPEETAHYLDQEGIAVRTGHHCAQPALERFGVTDVLRVSLGLYNTRAEVDTMIKVLTRVIKKHR